MKNSPDPRVKETQARLRQALMELVIEKSFTLLTIQDVTARAGLHRSTFYLHYTGLPELLEDCARELFAQMRADIYRNEARLDQPTPAHIEPFVVSVFHHLEQHKTFYRAMLGRHGDAFFRALFQEMLLELIAEPLQARPSAPEAANSSAITLRFFSAGFMGIAAWWIETDQPPLPAEEAARQVTQALLPDYLRLLAVI